MFSPTLLEILANATSRVRHNSCRVTGLKIQHKQNGIWAGFFSFA